MAETASPQVPDDHGGPRRRTPSAGHALLFSMPRLSRGRWWVLGIIAVALVAVAGVLLLFTKLDWGGLMQVIAALPPALLLPAMALLPLVGFPVLPVYLVAGARFGPYGGGVVVTLVSAVHLVGTYLIARSILRRPLERLLARWHAHLPAIPDDEQVAVAFIAALVPGVPYVIRNYLLAIIGLRLRVYFWIALPIYVARSYVSILLGDLGTAPDRNRLFILGGIETLKAVICAVVIWWLRAHHRRLHGEPAHGA